MKRYLVPIILTLLAGCTANITLANHSTVTPTGVWRNLDLAGIKADVKKEEATEYK